MGSGEDLVGDRPRFLGDGGGDGEALVGDRPRLVGDGGGEDLAGDRPRFFGDGGGEGDAGRLWCGPAAGRWRAHGGGGATLPAMEAAAAAWARCLSRVFLPGRLRTLARVPATLGALRLAMDLLVAAATRRPGGAALLRGGVGGWAPLSGCTATGRDFAREPAPLRGGGEGELTRAPSSETSSVPGTPSSWRRSATEAYCLAA